MQNKKSLVDHLLSKKLKKVIESLSCFVFVLDEILFQPATFFFCLDFTIFDMYSLSGIFNGTFYFCTVFFKRDHS